MLSDEIAIALAQFFDRVGPSHDEITALVGRAGFGELDPQRGTTEQVGKMKRVRTVLFRATGRPEADRLTRAFIEALRGHGSFVRTSPDFPGDARLESLRRAFRAQGYDLSADGRLMRISLDALEGVDLIEALEAYVDRSLRGTDDAPLLVGNGRDLVEAAARYAIEETSGAPATSANFDATLWHAFDRLGLATPDPKLLAQLDSDPSRAIQQAVWLLAVAQKRLRNEMGTGHGRPSRHSITPAFARFAGQAAGLVSRLLLDQLMVAGGRRAA